MVSPCWFGVTQIRFMNGSSAKNICPWPSHLRGGCVNFYLVWYMPWKVHAIIMSVPPPHSGCLSQHLVHNRCSVNISQNECLKERVTSQIHIFLLVLGSNYGFPTQIPRLSSFFWVAKRDFHVPKPSSHWPDRWCAESLSRRNKHASRFSWESTASELQLQDMWEQPSVWMMVEWFQVRQPGNLGWTMLWLQQIVVIEHMFVGLCFWSSVPRLRILSRGGKKKGKRTG